ncbi:MAG: DUF4465 domain-containing protein, partial [Thermodesulfobacteriota bacterium]|nr:DUF4465 domain-containing protein [Thermodesulfobacteriota bacterium]
GGGQYYNGSDSAGGFTSGEAAFVNNYNPAWSSWDGWSVSNTIDTTTAGFTNQYSAYTGGAYSGTQYGVYYEPFTLTSTVSWNTPMMVNGGYFTNTTYAALSMLNGDDFAKQFGGVTGNDPDWFLLTVAGMNENTVTGSVDFYLADYRFENNSQDYIVNAWTWLDLSGLGTVTSLKFDLSSSDVGDYGMNTPAYFAMDNLNAVPIPGTVLLLGSGLLGLLGLKRKRS